MLIEVNGDFKKIIELSLNQPLCCKLCGVFFTFWKLHVCQSWKWILITPPFLVCSLKMRLFSKTIQIWIFHIERMGNLLNFSFWDAVSLKSKYDMSVTNTHESLETLKTLKWNCLNKHSSTKAVKKPLEEEARLIDSFGALPRWEEVKIIKTWMSLGKPC